MKTTESKISDNVKWILVVTITAATSLMAASMWAPVEGAIKEVLPVATGLIGFAGGLVIAIFGK